MSSLSNHSSSSTNAPPAVYLPASGVRSADAGNPEANATDRASGDQNGKTLSSLPRQTIWNVPFDSVTLEQAVGRIAEMVERGTPSYAITANLNYVMLHHQQADLQQVTRDADLILADGQPIVWRSRLGEGRLPERVAGSEMIYRLAELASQKRWGIYFLGGEEGVAAACAERLQQGNPGMRIAGVESPPFRALTPQEQREQDERIRLSGAQILLVAFGQPKGERWIHQHHRRLGVPVSIQLGASFDFIAGTARRAPRFWQRLGLEWAYRMMSDPKRLAPRYAHNAAFLACALARDWKAAVAKWGFDVGTADELR